MQKFILSCAALFCAFVAAPALADSINLSYTTFGGNTATTEGPLTPDMGTAVPNGQSATLTSNNAETGAVWMDTSLNSHADLVSLNFDIDVLSQATTGYDQTFGNSPTLGGVRIVQNGIFAESLQMMPLTATSGVFAFRNADNTGVQIVGKYFTNAVYHIELDANYTTGTATAIINGGRPVNYSLRAGTGPGGDTSEIFVYLNGASGDNVHNSFTIGDPGTVAVPLPSAALAGLICLAGLGLFKIGRRRETAAIA
jgi:hypothetical protein